MTTITEQLHALKENKTDATKSAYVELLHTTGIGEHNAKGLRNIVKVCEAAGQTLEVFERDQNIAASLAAAQDTISTEQYYRDMCKKISHKIRDLRNSAPIDPRLRTKHTNEIRQHARLLSMNQTRLHQAEATRESLKKQKERFWWVEPYLETEQP